MIYYVNAGASRDGDGSREMPFRYIGDAAKIALAAFLAPRLRKAMKS